MPETQDDNPEIWPIDDPREPTSGGLTVDPNPVVVQNGLPREDEDDDQQQ